MLLDARGIGAVVETVSVTTESLFSDGTCAGLNEQVVNAADVEQLKLTLLENVPGAGEMSRV